MRISKLYSNGNKNGKAYYMYNCRQSRYSRKRCSFSKHIQYQQIEEFVINYIEDISKGVRNVDNFIDHSTDVAGERIKKIEIELDRVKRAYLAEVFTLEEYKDEKQRLEDELHLLLSDKNEEKIKLKMKNKIGTYYDKFRAAKTVQDKKVILQDIIEYIDVYEDALNICFKA
jgi:hypothetical protein